MAAATRNDVEKLVQQQLSADPEFRARLLADPRAVVSELSGTAVPESVTIEVHEESLTHVHLVIPAAAASEIPDGDLELVAGGTCWSNSCGGTVGL